MSDRHLSEDAETTGLRDGLVIEALLTEYKNVHQRVLSQVEQYESTNARILTLLGVLFFFGIEQFSEVDNWYMSFIVSGVFIILVPLIAAASLTFAAAHMVKIMIWGDFLKTVENKVNKVLRAEADCLGFERGHVMNWEYWRVAHGYAGRNFFSVVSFSAFLIVSFVVAAVASVWLRLRFIAEACPVRYPTWAYIAAAVFALSLGLSAYSWARFREQRIRSLGGVLDDDAV